MKEEWRQQPAIARANTQTRTMPPSHHPPTTRTTMKWTASDDAQGKVESRKQAKDNGCLFALDSPHWFVVHLLNAFACFDCKMEVLADDGSQDHAGILRKIPTFACSAELSRGSAKSRIPATFFRSLDCAIFLFMGLEAFHCRGHFTIGISSTTATPGMQKGQSLQEWHEHQRR
jgi:hypothetical protein